MWKDIKLLGRDRLLSRQVRPRLKEDKGFVLTGTHGAGKTAILEWVKENAGGKVCMVSATSTVKEVMQQICTDWHLEVKNDEDKVVGRTRWQVAWMERAILQVTNCWLLVDDIHRITPALLRRLKLLRDRVKIVAAGVPPFQREELRRVLWGLPEVKVGPLPKEDMMRIAQAAVPLLGSRTPAIDAVHAARGLPGQLINALRGEVTPDSAKVQGEEIDISPVFLIVVAMLMITRYVAVGMESTSLYIIGGFGMGIGLIVRFYMFRGMEARKR